MHSQSRGPIGVCLRRSKGAWGSCLKQARAHLSINVLPFALPSRHPQAKTSAALFGKKRRLAPAAAPTETPTFDPRWAGSRGSGALYPPARQPRLDAKIADHDRQVVDECAGERILVQGWHGERPRPGTNTGQQDGLSLKGGGDSGRRRRAAREDQAAAGQGDTFGAACAGEGRARAGPASITDRK